MAFDVPNNLTNVVELLPFADQVTGNILGTSILLVIAVTTLFVTSAFNARESLLTTAFVVWISSFLLMLLNLLSAQVIILATVFVVVAAFAASVKSQGA